MDVTSRGDCGSEAHNTHPVTEGPGLCPGSECRGGDGDVPEWKQQIQAEPLVGPAETLESLVQEFESNEALRAKARTFMKEQEKIRTSDRGLPDGEAEDKDGSARWVMRRVRKDGCCFYRGYMFGLFLSILRRRKEIRAFIKKIKEDLLPKVLQVNGGAETCSDFAQETVDNLEKLEATGASEETVAEIFNDPSSSNYIVVFARSARMSGDRHTPSPPNLQAGVL
ncbi:ubiquitin thioesterase otubain-like family protein, partial [Cystoisospora suis]